jgi:hypothetical protein
VINAEAQEAKEEADDCASVGVPHHLPEPNRHSDHVPSRGYERIWWRIEFSGCNTAKWRNYGVKEAEAESSQNPS